MTQLIDKILQGIGNDLGKILTKLFSSIDRIFDYLQTRADQKQKKETDKKLKDSQDKIEDVAQNGDIDDLLDLK